MTVSTPPLLSDEQADRPRRNRREVVAFAKKVTVFAAAVGGLIGGISTALGLFFLVRPNLAPSTTNRAEITQIAVEPNVTLQAYLSHFFVKMALPRIQNALPKENRPLLIQHMNPRLATVGTVVYFGLEIDGLNGHSIGERWSVFDADSGARLGESEDLDPLALDFRPEKSGSDTGAWEIWVDTSQFSSRHFFVRLELYDEQDGSAIGFKDTPPFERPQ